MRIEAARIVCAHRPRRRNTRRDGTAEASRVSPAPSGS